MLSRGFVLDRVQKVIGSTRTAPTIAAILIQALLFGFFHLYQGLGGMLLSFVIGAVMGLIWLIGGRNLWAPILLHGIIDSIGFTGYYSGG